LHANLTQEELAEKVGVGWRTIHRIEYGTSDPSLSALLRIAAAVRVSLPDLISTSPFAPRLDQDPSP
jgi:DNA-binding XRE family transcriptional regulator